MDYTQSNTFWKPLLREALVKHSCRQLNKFYGQFLCKQILNYEELLIFSLELEGVIETHTFCAITMMKELISLSSHLQLRKRLTTHIDNN